MKQLSIMLKPASSICNLRCRYCFYEDIASERETPSFGKMSRETMVSILSNIRKDLEIGDHVTFAFQGGEPMLAGLEYYQNFISVTDKWKGIHVSYALQTNGTLLDDEWCRFLKGHHFLAGISWDILKDCHNGARVDVSGNGTYRPVEKAIDLLNERHVEYNVLCTLTNFVARHPDKVWREIAGKKLRYVQFTPCLDFLGEDKHSAYALTPQRFFSFYDQLFSIWFPAFREGNYISIKLFDDIVNLLAFHIPTSCGINGICSEQLVVEADGSTYPCDFYCLPEYCLGNLSCQSLREVHDSPNAEAFLHRDKDLPKLCGSCQFSAFCHGNCPRMRPQIGCVKDDKFCGYQAFLNAHANEFAQIAEMQLRMR